MSDQMPDSYDRLLGSLDGLPDVVHTRPATIRSVGNLGVGGSRTYIVQTYRQDKRGDTIFLEVGGPEGMVRLAIPAKVAAVIARQREGLTKQSRSRTAKRVAAGRKERGELPGFMLKKA